MRTIKRLIIDSRLIVGLSLIGLLFTLGCKTAGTYDPVKTAQVKAAITPIATGAVHHAIVNSPQHATATGNYFRAVGSVFCQMSSTASFDPVMLVAAADAATGGLQAGVDPYVIDAKNALIAIYKIYYADRFRAELSPEKWPKNLADVICDSIDQGLKDSGQTGVK